MLGRGRSYYLSLLGERDMILGEDGADFDHSEDGWKKSEFRQHVSMKLEEAVRRSHYPMRQCAAEMEQEIFDASESNMDYLDFLARLFSRVRQFGGYGSYSTELPSLAVMEQRLVDPVNDIGALRHLRREKNQALAVEKSHLSYEMTSIQDFPIPSLYSGSMISPFGRSKAGEKYAHNYVWQMSVFRKFVIKQIDAILLRHGIPRMKTVINMELKIFEKSESYAAYVASVDILLRELKCTTRVFNFDNSKLEDIPEPVASALRDLHNGGMYPVTPRQPRPLRSWRSEGQIVLGA